MFQFLMRQTAAHFRVHNRVQIGGKETKSFKILLTVIPWERKTPERSQQNQQV